MSNSAYSSSQQNPRPLRTLVGHSGKICSMAFLPDGQRLVTGAWDRTVRVWTVGDGRQEGKEMTHVADIRLLVVTSDGSKIISCDDDKRVKVWDVATHDIIKEWQHSEHSRLSISADDQLVAYGNHTIVVRELDGDQIKQRLRTGGLYSLCFSPDRFKLACGLWMNTVIYDIDTGQSIHILKGHRDLVSSLVWSCNRLYTSSHDKTIRCWNTETGDPIGEPWAGHTSAIRSISLSPDGTKIASGSEDNTVRFWDPAGHPIGHPLQHEGKVFSVCISPSQDVVAAAGFQERVFLWPVPRNDGNQPNGAALSEPDSKSAPDPPNQLQAHDTHSHIVGRLFDLPSTPSQTIDSDHRASDTTTLSQSPATADHPRFTFAPTEAEATSLPAQLRKEISSDLNSFPDPLDLTQYIVKIDARHRETGGFSDVHRCNYFGHSGTTQVAVKSFRFHFMIEEGSRSSKMIRRELGIWRRLKHPNIVPFLGYTDGFGMQDSKSLVSLWMPNGTLHKFMTSRDAELRTTHRFQLLLDVANGLEYLHSFQSSPIIHGDLNGNNVLLDANFVAHLTDFGYSSFMGNLPEGLEYLERSTVRPGATRWIAPEQLEDSYEMTPKSDIYSFGCISFQVLTGRKPWSEVRDDAGVILRLARGQKPKRPALRVIDDSHWAFIQGCWSSVEDRPTAGKLVFLLQDLLSSCPQSPSLRDMLSSS